MGFTMLLSTLIIGIILLVISSKITSKFWKMLIITVGIALLLLGIILLFAPGFSHQVYDQLYNLLN